MNYYAAPMEGLTDRIWRQVHQKWFGAADAPTRYYAPFLSPPENRVLIPKKMAELAPEANAGTVVIPQLLARDGELAAWMIGEVRKLGYTEVNLNFGCPSGTVTAKGKGAGMLRDPARLDAFLDAVFSAVEGPVSVKTRIGVQKPEEFAVLLDIYNHYPICELTIHPRVMKQLYRGEADRAAFAAALPECRMPVCYNGDVTTPEALHALEAEFPQLSGIMVGRGLIADPASDPLCPFRLLRRPLPRLHRGLWCGQLCRQPDEGALVLSHPSVRRGRPAGKASPQGPRGVGV